MSLATSDQRELSAPVSAPHWLDRRLFATLTVERALWFMAALLLLALLSRFWELGSRALHHDESLHAYYSWLLYDRGQYRHEPLMHGPVLFHLTAFGFWLFGDSDATSRLIPALLGVALVGAPWCFRDWLGRRGALATAALILISPTLLYYSRFIRHDIFVAAWTVLIIYGMWRYLQRGQLRDIVVMALGWGLLFAQKEVSFLIAVVFWSFLALVLLLRKVGLLGPRPALRESREFHLLIFIGALLLPFVTAFLMHAPLLLNDAFNLSLPILDPGVVGGNSETSVYNTPWDWSLAFNLRAYLTLFLLMALGAWVARRWWNLRAFLIGAGAFYAIFLLFQTTFLTNIWGLGSGMIGALGYWLEQHGVRRGEQPWFYYLMLLPLYELLPLVVGVGGGLALLLTGRNARIAPHPGEGPSHLNVRALWPWFNLWWFFVTLLLLSYAGEKMPWLLVHLALPLAFMGGWALDRMTRGLSWGVLRRHESGLVLLLTPLLLISLGGLLYLAFTGQRPWPINDGTVATVLRWLLAVLFLFGSAAWLQQLASALGNRITLKLGLLTVVGLMTLMTVRYAVIASYVHGDIASEPLIYTQTTPKVTELMADLDALSERTTGAKNLAVAYDSTASWPFSWYLRDYPNGFFFANDPTAYTDSIRNATVILAGDESNNELAPLVSDFTNHTYKLRWWFPEDYKEVRLVPGPNPNDPNSTIEVERDAPLPLLRKALSYWRQPTYRKDLIDFLLYRDLVKPLDGASLFVYTQPDVVRSTWSLGDTLSASQADATSGDVSDHVVATLGSADTLSRPTDLALLPDGTIAVTDSGNSRIQLFAADGTLLRTLGGPGAEPGQFAEPWGIAAAPDGTLYVADTFNHRIQHLDSAGNVLQTWGEFGDTQGALGDPMRMYGPRDLVLDSAGELYVSDTGNERILVFDGQGNFLRQFGGAGSEAGQFAEPVGLAFDAAATLWVADTWNQRLQQLSRSGEPLQQLAVEAWAGQSLTNKPFIAVTDGQLWLTDPDTARLITVDQNGGAAEAQPSLTHDALLQPHGLLVVDRLLWLVDSGNNRLLQIKP